MSLHIFAAIMTIEEAIQQKSFSDEVEKTVVNLLYTGNWVHAVNSAVLKKHNLTTQQYNVMRILKGHYPNPSQVSSISERMLDKMSNASRLVEKLRQKGLVVRTNCEVDRRQVDVSLTPKGLELLELANHSVKEAFEAFRILSPQESETLNQLLDKLRSCGSNFEKSNHQ